MKTAYFLLIMLTTFHLVSCTTEISTEQSMARTELASDAEVDLFILNHSVYIKMNDQMGEIEENELEHVGEIEHVYSGEGNLEMNMATVLPKGTELYQKKDNFVYLYVKTDQGFFVYKAVPEG